MQVIGDNLASVIAVRMLVVTAGRSPFKISIHKIPEYQSKMFLLDIKRMTLFFVPILWSCSTVYLGCINIVYVWTSMGNVEPQEGWMKQMQSSVKMLCIFKHVTYLFEYTEYVSPFELCNKISWVRFLGVLFYAHVHTKLISYKEKGCFVPDLASSYFIPAVPGQEDTNTSQVSLCYLYSVIQAFSIS